MNDTPNGLEKAPSMAPYGSWPSPVSVDLCARAARPLAAPAVDEGHVFWLEGVFAEGGRLTLKRSADGIVEDWLPAPYNVRTRIHEYGGGAALVEDGIACFSHFVDNQVYRRHHDGTVAALTAERDCRFGDFVLDRARRRLICVSEKHDDPGHEPRNRLSAIALDGPDIGSAVTELHAGRDFYASPCVSPDGRHLAWLSWSHPQMPWDGSELWLAEFAADGSLLHQRCVAGGPDESLFQPRWSPLGFLHVVSDRTGWWNLYRVEDERLVAICPMEAEFGEPAWQLGQSMYDFAGPDEIVAIRIEDGVHRLGRIDATGTMHDVPTALTWLDALRVAGGAAFALGASATMPLGVVRIDLATGAVTTIAQSFENPLADDAISHPRRITYTGREGNTVHAVYYPPHHPSFVAPADTLPPLIVQGHGGPTAMTNTALRLGNQFWTGRGFAILDVDYTGSAGYGRAYRDALKGRWGEADVADFVDGARHLVEAGLVDPDRIAIRGGSASGYATLCALAFHDVFTAGVSHYGVSDLATLFAETHKFESRYGQALIGWGSDIAALAAARSPLNHVDRIDVPVLFFQGLDDRVVPPSQSERLFTSLRARGIPATYLAFAGEGHGFRKFETLTRVITAELAFYADVFHFVPADPSPSAGAGGPLLPVSPSAS